jgi:hemolysin III
VLEPISLPWLRDPVSALTHLGAAVFDEYVTLLFVRLTRYDWIKRQSLLVFGLSMILLYTASGVYHAVPGHRGDEFVEFFRRLDLCAIFLLIAGTFTPIIAVLLTGRQRRIMLTAIWSLATIGIASRFVLVAVPHPITVATFVLAGLPGFVPYRQYVRAVGRRGFAWGVAGAVFYAIGGICDVIDWPNPIPGIVNAHELTHLLDMAGTACHIVFMIRYIVPYQRPQQPRARRRREAALVLAGNV